ncbi:uncharacterized protein V6R79_004075 [Siganus canaliculatus]
MPTKAEQQGATLRSLNIASLIPEPLPQSCQSPRYALLLRHPTPNLTHSPYPSPHICTSLCLPPSIPDCSPPRTAKDILLSEIRVISADTTWQPVHSCLWREDALWVLLMEHR